MSSNNKTRTKPRRIKNREDAKKAIENIKKERKRKEEEEKLKKQIASDYARANANSWRNFEVDEKYKKLKKQNKKNKKNKSLFTRIRHKYQKLTNSDKKKKRQQEEEENLRGLAKSQQFDPSAYYKQLRRDKERQESISKEKELRKIIDQFDKEAKNNEQDDVEGMSMEELAKSINTVNYSKGKSTIPPPPSKLPQLPPLPPEGGTRRRKRKRRRKTKKKRRKRTKKRKKRRRNKTKRRRR
jgi:hypothetical protein